MSGINRSDVWRGNQTSGNGFRRLRKVSGNDTEFCCISDVWEVEYQTSGVEYQTSEKGFRRLKNFSGNGIRVQGISDVWEVGFGKSGCRYS